MKDKRLISNLIGSFSKLVQKIGELYGLARKKRTSDSMYLVLEQGLYNATSNNNKFLLAA